MKEGHDLAEMKETAKKLENTAEKVDIALAESRLQFELMLDMQKDERMELNRMHIEEKEKMRKHYGRIIAGLLATLLLFIGSIIGAAIYILANYDIGLVSYYQELSSEGDGDQTIEDGIHYNSD